MGSSYNRIAGQRLDRLCALSDGVFAVAMTLLVLDLHVPVAAAIHSERELGQGLLALAPRVVPYLMSFLTLGIFWVGQQTLLNTLVRGDRNLSWIQIAFLLAVSITPFSTALLASFVTYRLALVIYWLDLVALGLTILWSSRYAQKAGLISDDVPAASRRALERRILFGQSLYAFGALLCLISTYWSITFIVLVQLSYAFGLRWPGRLEH